VPNYWWRVPIVLSVLRKKLLCLLITGTEDAHVSCPDMQALSKMMRLLALALPSLPLSAVVASSPAKAAVWVGLSGDRNRELTKCAAPFGGGNVHFLPNQSSSWPAGTTGSGACTREHAGACSKVIDWQCHVLPCSASASLSARLTLCEGQPAPPPPPPCTATGPPHTPQQQQCAAVPLELRIGCGKPPHDTAELCAQRGCCWDPSSPVSSPPVVLQAPPPPGCLGGSLSTPAAGVHVLSWSKHVAFANPSGIHDVEVHIAGYVHGGQRGGPGPCCGNVFNVSVSGVNNVGFDVKVTRFCGASGCHGKFIGWGQQLLLSWKAGSAACPFPQPAGPTPPPPPPPPQCYYGKAGLPPNAIREVLIVDADHLDEGYHGQVTDVNNR
jgi:hypothetical protein